MLPAVGLLTPSCSSPVAATDLAESANVEEADCCDLGSMLLHCQFGIEQNAKVAHDVGELDRSLHIDSK